MLDQGLAQLYSSIEERDMLINDLSRNSKLMCTIKEHLDMLDTTGSYS
jgi:hypothetical protein